MRNYTVILLTIFALTCNAQNETDYLTKSQIATDLTFLDVFLQNNSSYQGLNGFDYKQDFDDYLEKLGKQSTLKYDFELFLSKTIGKIGDRHSYIKGERLSNSLFFPFAFAPYNDKVLVLDEDREKNEYYFYDAEFPYLKSINKIPIEDLLPQILLGEVLAPKKSYSLRAVRELRDIEIIFKALNLDLPNPTLITLENEKGFEKQITVKLVSKKERARYWDERMYRDIFILEEERYNEKAFIEKFFKLEDNIGYIQIASMIHKEDNPIFFDYLNDFMIEAKQSDAIIIDVRDNEGGTRDLIQELAGYFVHPDSIYVVNATKQRGQLPLNEELKETLHFRLLFSKDELDSREKIAVDKFMTFFKPMYDLDSYKFSEYHYYILNGQKITKNKYHYNKPIYILANERTFSAASVLVSVFKEIPNIKIVGVNTDGSSGNSDRFELPNSEFRGKISTMVSYQKDGQILDGIGTKPDILIERNLNQIFWKEDYQLNKLIEIIKKD